MRWIVGICSCGVGVSLLFIGQTDRQQAPARQYGWMDGMGTHVEQTAEAAPATTAAGAGADSVHPPPARFGSTAPPFPALCVVRGAGEMSLGFSSAGSGCLHGGTHSISRGKKTSGATTRRKRMKKRRVVQVSHRISWEERQPAPLRISMHCLTNRSAARGDRSIHVVARWLDLSSGCPDQSCQIKVAHRSESSRSPTGGTAG